MRRSIVLVTVAITMMMSRQLYSQNADTCEEPKEVESHFTSAYMAIANKSQLNVDDVRKLLLPLKEGFGFDRRSCVGYTRRVKKAATDVISNRATEIAPILKTLCSQETSGSLNIIAEVAMELPLIAQKPV